LRILELREGATEGEVKAAYQAMSRIYHPDKHNSGFTGMSDEEAVELFQQIISTSEQCAQLFTRDNVTERKNDTEERYGREKEYKRTNYDLELQEGEIY
jgi:hypothetical protein